MSAEDVADFFSILNRAYLTGNKPENEAQCNIYTLLKTPLHAPPPIYGNNVATVKKDLKLTATKSLTQTVLTVPQDKQMKRVVYAPRMLKNLMRHQAEQQTYPLDGTYARGASLITTIHPTSTSQFFPGRVNSEADVALICHTSILRPAVAAYLGQRNLEGGPQQYPFLASSAYGSVIPDQELLDGPRTNTNVKSEQAEANAQQKLAKFRPAGERPAVSIEYKVDNVIRRWQEVDHIVPPLKIPRTIFLNLQTLGRNTAEVKHFPEGSAIKFIWPKDLSTDSDHLTRILIQVRVYLSRSSSAAFV